MPAPRNARPEPDEPDATEAEAEEETDVDLDLLAGDALYREALAEPVLVRLPTGDVISVPPMADWPHVGTRMMTSSLFDGWADTVLAEKDAAAFKRAGLRNYQIEKITSAIASASGTTPGKRRPSSPSRKSTRRR
jgi:hypothetical protein